tara:strand:+ start:413 stop:982 length:570 start_codon:yes stop_codon:yes gene_type:complete
MEELGLEPADYATVRAAVGGSTDMTMKNLVGPDLAKRGLDIYPPIFESVMLEGLHSMPGAIELLQALLDLGEKTAVFTNKVGKHARAACDHLGITPLVEQVIGVKDTPWRKPEVEFTNHLLKLLNASAEESLLVGDSPFDFDSAANVGMECRLVTTGTHSAKQLEHLGALSIHEDLFSLAQETWGLELR